MEVECMKGGVATNIIRKPKKKKKKKKGKENEKEEKKKKKGWRAGL